MRHNLKAGGIGLLAIAVALAMLVAPVMAAAPTVDTETTDTATTSDLTDGTTINFSANSSTKSYIEGSFDSTNASIEIVDPATGEVHASNDSAAMKQTFSNSTSSTYYYAWNMTHSSLATMPMDAGQNKSVTIRFINDTSLESPDTTEITVYLQNSDDRAVVYAGDGAAAGTVTGLDVTTETDDGIPLFGSNSSTTTIEADNVGLGTNATGTTVHVIAANTSGEDPFTEATDSKWGGSYAESELHKGHRLNIAGHKHAVFHTSTPDYLVDGYTYATTDEINGHDAYTVHVADDYSGESSLDITTKANEKYGPVEGLFVKSAAKDGTLSNSFLASTGTTGAVV